MKGLKLIWGRLKKIKETGRLKVKVFQTACRMLFAGIDQARSVAAGTLLQAFDQTFHRIRRAVDTASVGGG